MECAAQAPAAQHQDDGAGGEDPGEEDPCRGHDRLPHGRHRRRPEWSTSQFRRGAEPHKIGLETSTSKMSDLPSPPLSAVVKSFAM